MYSNFFNIKNRQQSLNLKYLTSLNTVVSTADQRNEVDYQFSAVTLTFERESRYLGPRFRLIFIISLSSLLLLFQTIFILDYFKVV